MTSDYSIEVRKSAKVFSCRPDCKDNDIMLKHETKQSANYVLTNDGVAASAGIPLAIKRLSRAILPCSKTPSTADISATMNSRLPLVDSSFQGAIWPVLAVAQCFGMMPIVGVRGGITGAKASADSLKFRWRSWRVMWAVFYLITGSMLACLYVKWLHKTGVATNNIGRAIIFFTSLSCSLLLLRLAREWSALSLKWSQIERPFLHQPYRCDGQWLLSTKIRLTAVCFFLLTFLDYSLYMVQSVYNYWHRVQVCKWPDYRHLRRYFMMESPYIFEVWSFSVPVALLKLVVDIFNMVGASYGNIFVMLISIALSTRYRQLGQRLKRIADGSIPESTWAEVRIHYIDLCELLETVNLRLGPLILLCCVYNLYYVCAQLLNIFDELDHLSNNIYYWFSLFYLLARTIGLFLTAGRIYDAAWQPMQIIRRIPSAEYGLEAERFYQLIMSERPALSGMRFFCLNRNNLLTLAGTIVTYEVVLMQFAESGRSAESKLKAALASCVMWEELNPNQNSSLIG